MCASAVVHSVFVALLPLLFERRNLRDLVDLCEGDPHNHCRAFWRWIERQPWRKLLPAPIECHGLNMLNGHVLCAMAACYALCIAPLLGSL